MESITTFSSTFINQNSNNFYYDIKEFNTTSFNSNVNQNKNSTVSQAKLEKLRSLQNKVDMLEANKVSLGNQIYDLRQLLQKVNQQGERKLVHIKNRNAILKNKIQSLQLALEASRDNASHFENIYSYWSWNLQSYCDDDDCSQEFDFVDTSSFGSTHHDIPSLTTASSCYSSEKSSIICAKIMMRREEEPELEEEPQQPEQQQLHQLLHPKLLKLSDNNRGFRGDCDCKKGKGSKSLSKVVDVVTKTTDAADAKAMLTKQ